MKVRRGDTWEPVRRVALARRRALGASRWGMSVLAVALAVLLASHLSSVARAADGLPAGIPTPSWAKSMKIHFEPAELHAARPVNGGVAAGATKLGPLTALTPRLRYFGGPVENEPRLILVFLGQEWEAEPALSLRHELETTAQGLSGSSYQAILTQYSGLDGPISQPLAGSPTVEEYYVKRAITGKMSGVEVIQAGSEVAELTGGSQNTNLIYEVLPAPGIAEMETGICGFHAEDDGKGTIAIPGPSIAAIMDTDAIVGCLTSKTLTHEYAESVTDPGSSGWKAGEGSEEEIADICNERAPGRMADGALVAWLWDDSKDACEIEDSDPEPVPIGPYTETSRRNPSLEGSTNLTVESEALETSIYPCGMEAHYYFEYGPTTAYGNKTPESAAPAGWGAVKVSATIAGLQHSTPYHWRVVVTTANGTAEGVDHEFTIPYSVEIEEERASEVGSSEATLNGQVQPVGVEAKYHFEYGTTEAYGSSTAEASAGSGNSFVKVSAALVGLEPGTLYHFRLVASSSRGTTTGKDQRFETNGGKPGVKTSHALSVRYTEAELRATIRSKEVPTTFYFEYGTTEVYEHQTAERSIEEGSVSGAATIEDLNPGTLYHFRIVATNSYGTSYGADESFSTVQEPLVETGMPGAVGYDTAVLNGAIDPYGTKTSYWFEYGTSLSYGEWTAEVAAGTGTSNVGAAQTVSGLAESTTYHFRMVARTIYGTTYGADREFTTGVQPAVEINPPASPPIVESVVTPPLAPLPPITGSTPTPTPTRPTPGGPSLGVAQHGDSLSVLIKLEGRATRVEIDVTVSSAQLGPAKRKGHRGPVRLARSVHAKVKAGASKFFLRLEPALVRALARRGSKLTVIATITSSSGVRHRVSRTLKLV